MKTYKNGPNLIWRVAALGISWVLGGGLYAQQPTGVFSTSGVGISSEGDLWFQDATGWAPLGNAYLMSRPMASVSNVLGLVKAPCWSNTLAKVIQTLGYYTPGDGGGGMYVMTPVGATNMGRFASTNSAYMWELLPDVGGARLRQYGAKGDGVADDTAAVKDWLHDVDRKIGSVTPGRYSISPIYTEANAVLTVQGVARFGMANPNLTPFIFDGNSAIFQRRAGSNPSVSLFNVVSNATLNCYNIAFDGNKASNASATEAYLYVINGGLSSEMESCFFFNSAGHGICIVGSSGNWSVIRNVRIWDVNRGVRLNQASGVTMNNIHIQGCRENGLNLMGFTSQLRASQLFIADCAENGILIEGAQNNRINDSIIQTTFKSSVMFSTTNGANPGDNSFFQCSLKNANAASSSLLGTSPYVAGLYAAVTVTGNATADYSTRNRFDGCVFGDLSGGLQSRGTSNFAWLAPVGGARYPWELWMFSNNQHVWNAGWTSDFSPMQTNSVGEVNVIRANNEFNSKFGKTGAIGSAGWRMDIVEVGVASGTVKNILSDATSHKLLRDTSAIGTPIALQQAAPDPFLPAPPAPRKTPVPDP